jgi:glycine dehydrogenase subunit 2
MSMNNQGRPTSVEPSRRAPIAPGTHTPEELSTISGDRGLDHEEALIFELGHGAIGVDLPDVQISGDRLGGMRRKDAIGLPGLSEPEVIRHYVRLSRMNYAIDSGLYPLGSCTMKHNPRLNEKMARGSCAAQWPGRFRRPEGQAGAGCCGDHAYQPQYLRPFRKRNCRDCQGRA